MKNADGGYFATHLKAVFVIGMKSATTDGHFATHLKRKEKMQTLIEKALNDIARELREIRKLLEKDMKAPVKGMIDENNKITLLNKPWRPIDCLSNNPEAHDWRITEDERSN